MKSKNLVSDEGRGDSTDKIAWIVEPGETVTIS